MSGWKTATTWNVLSEKQKEKKKKKGIVYIKRGATATFSEQFNIYKREWYVNPCNDI